MPRANPPDQTGNTSTPTIAFPPRRDAITRPVMGLLVGLFVLVGYAQSLTLGLWLDDHPHFLHLKEMDWGYRGAVEEAFLAIPGEVSDFWGRTEPPIRFYRPVAFTLMKIQYTLGRWRPEIMHGFSMAWHFACAMLVGALAMRCFGNRTWATVAACLMAIHPAHVGTVSWIACQTELMTTAFQLVAILAYSRHARWGERFVYPDDSQSDRPRGWFRGRPAAMVMNPPGETAGSVHPSVTPAIILSLLSFGLALGCRENAVMLPVVCWLGDWLCGAGRRRRIRWEHVTMVVMVAVYLGIRNRALGGFHGPTWPELMALTHGKAVQFLIDKTLVYVLGIVSYIPIMPVVTAELMEGHPIAFYGMALVLVAAFLVIWRSFGWGPAVLWPTIATFLLMAPTLPIYPSAHHLYLPSIGAVVVMAALLALIGGIRRPRGSPLPRFRKAVLGFILVAHVLGLSGLTWMRGYLLRTTTMTEDLLVDDVINKSGPIRSGDHLFFINQPVLAYYASCAVRIKKNLPALCGHTLMYAPYLVRMEAPATLEVVDSHRLRLRAPKGEPYLAGLGGQTILNVMRLPRPKTGQKFTANLDQYEVDASGKRRAKPCGDRYTVLIKDADAKGVRELEYIFDKPLNSPEYHFYFGSPWFLAYPVDVSRPTLPASQPTTAPAG
jgi:hypothetical protein